MLREKTKKPKSEFLDEEAEVSEDDNEGDDENSEEDEEEEDEEEKEEELKPSSAKKSRIKRAFVDEDSNSGDGEDVGDGRKVGEMDLKSKEESNCGVGDGQVEESPRSLKSKTKTFDMFLSQKNSDDMENDGKYLST